MHQLLHEDNSIVVHSTEYPTSQFMTNLSPKPKKSKKTKVRIVLGLAISQLVFGSLVVLLGTVTIAGTSLEYWVSHSGSGIWFGFWIVLTGIVCIASTRQRSNRCLKGINMGFNTTCSVLSLCLIVLYGFSIVHFRNCEGVRYFHKFYESCDKNVMGVITYCILLLMTIAEFFVSLTISIICCRSLCIGNRCCESSPGIHMHPVDYHVTTANTGGGAPMTVITSTKNLQIKTPHTIFTSSHSSTPTYNVNISQTQATPQQERVAGQFTMSLQEPYTIEDSPVFHNAQPYSSKTLNENQSSMNAITNLYYENDEGNTDTNHFSTN